MEQPDAVDRAVKTLGSSGHPVYRAVRAALVERVRGKARKLLDVGCGGGSIRPYVAEFADEYAGCDLVRYPVFPEDCAFIEANLDVAPYPLPDGFADIVISVETIEHLENPRMHVRELARICRPDGLVIVTTPNNLSLLSLATLLRKGTFNAFQEGPGLYPSHLTALLDTDLRRIFSECGLGGVEIRFTNSGRIPFSARHWPGYLRGRRFSDNMLAVGQKPAASE